MRTKYVLYVPYFSTNKGSSINDVTILGGSKGFFDDSTKALVIKCVTMRGEESNIVQNCVTSFMDDL